MTNIRLLLADDHAIVRRGLELYLKTQPDFELVGEASTGTEVLERVAELEPDIVLMDLHMPELNGIEATRRIRESHPAVKVIVLTSFADHDHVLPPSRPGPEAICSRISSRMSSRRRSAACMRARSRYIPKWPGC